MSAGRYELKFVISAAERARLLEAARGLLRPDPHGAQAARYRVTSQYLDAPDLAAVRSKLDGVSRRAKLRVRFYGEVEAGAPEPLAGRPGFLEVKRRRKDQVFKERVALPPAELAALLADPARLEQLAPRLAAGKALVPACVITYQREALLGVLDPDLRVSLDSELRAFHPDAWDAVSGQGGARFLAEGSFILELKFRERIPRWLRDRVAQQGLRVRRFSKYAEGALALGR